MMIEAEALIAAIRGENITVTLPARLWECLLYAASLGTPMYGSSTDAAQARVAWQLVSHELEEQT